jgi:hypothetical protein
MNNLSPEDWVKILTYSGVLAFLILVLGITIYVLRHYLVDAAERDKSDIRKKVKLLEFRLRGFRGRE